MWVCNSLNKRIFEKVEDIVEQIKHYNISKQLGTPTLLNTGQPQTKNNGNYSSYNYNYYWYCNRAGANYSY